LSDFDCLCELFNCIGERDIFETAPNKRASFLRAFLGLTLQRRHHFIHSAERTTDPASLEILKAFGETTINDGLWSKRNLAFLYAGFEYISDVHASLLTDRSRQSDLKFSFYSNDRHVNYSLRV